MGKSSKMENYAMKHKMHLSLQLLGLVDDLIWEFNLVQTNQLTSKNLDIF